MSAMLEQTRQVIANVEKTKDVMKASYADVTKRIEASWDKFGKHLDEKNHGDHRKHTQTGWEYYSKTEANERRMPG